MGVREVAAPVIFSIATTCVAFAPLLFVPGLFGKFFKQIPVVVILVLVLSLFESLLILPAHLGHSSPLSGRGLLNGALRGLGVHHLDRWQQRFGVVFESFVAKRYAPFLAKAVERGGLTLAICAGVLIVTVGAVAGGRVGFSFIPKIESDFARLAITMPYGTSVGRTRDVQDAAIRAAERVVRRYGRRADVARGVLAAIGEQGLVRSPGGGAGSAGGPSAHIAEVVVGFVPSEQRSFTAAQFTERWRADMGEVPGVESMRFQYATGADAGMPIQFELSHRSLETLRQASAELAGRLREFDGLIDVDDGYARGKDQLDLKLSSEGRALGVTEAELATQVRHALFGAEAVRQQRGRDEVRVYVRRPKGERESLSFVEGLLVRTPQGGEIPLSQAAHVRRGRAYTTISRIDGRRVFNVTADTTASVNATAVVGQIEKDVMPQLIDRYPGLAYALGGEQKTQAETLGGLRKGFALALLGMFALMAIAFRSYTQPLIIMTAIPFGLVGAVLGHMLLGFNLSIMSMFGVVALSGVVVNDSLILISAINEYRRSGMSLRESVLAGGQRRFRPILLTSLTTFLGLTPMILEQSTQARFLIPMALSLGFGVMGATFITLLLVPALYVMLDGAKRSVAIEASDVPAESS